MAKVILMRIPAEYDDTNYPVCEIIKCKQDAEYNLSIQINDKGKWGEAINMGPIVTSGNL